jgi:UDP-N-acetylmuramoylalanine--D-glutamate ligase
VSLSLDEIARRSVIIAGFGVEGRDLYRYLRKRFPDKGLAIAEARPLDAEAQALVAGDRHLTVYLGVDHLNHLAAHEVVFRSPGIPLAHPALRGAKARGAEVTSQTALFLALCERPVIGVSGTKGKSTTTALIHAILTAAGREPYLVGNIGPDLGGDSPLLTLERAGSRAIFVFELSSFQLEGLEVSPDIAVLLDVVPEHLDYHGTLDAYVDAKENLTRHQRARDWLVFDAGSPVASAIAARTRAQTMPCRVAGPVDRGCFVENGQRVVFAAAFGRENIIDVSEVTRTLPGHFNLRNVLAAVAVARILSIDTVSVVRGITGFQPLRDRFENVGTFRGVTFFNAAIATVPEATLAHLETLAPSISTVILGGVDRGADYTTLARRILADGLRAVILFPDTGARVWQAIEQAGSGASLPRRIDVTDMESAVRAAFGVTPAGSICLHSPAAPSRGGLWKSYADRGAEFRDWVTRLGAGG